MNPRQRKITKLLEKKIAEVVKDNGPLVERLDLWHNHGQDRLGYYPYNPADNKTPIKIHFGNKSYFAGIVAGAYTRKNNYVVIEAGLSYIPSNSYWDAAACVKWAGGKSWGACADKYLDDIVAVTKQDKAIKQFLQIIEKHHLHAVSNFPAELPTEPDNIGRELSRKEKQEWKPFYPTASGMAEKVFIEKLSIACGLWTDNGFDAAAVQELLGTNETAINMLQLAMSGHHDKLPDAILEFEPVKKGMDYYVHNYLADMEYIKKTVLTLPETYIFTVS